MKNFIVLFAVILFSTNSFAQSNKEDVDMIQAMFGKEKKELIQQYMTIPDAKSAKFWAMYDKYEDERKALGRQRIKLIEAYATAYETLSDAKAAELMNKKLTWTTSYSALQKKYFTSMSTLIGGIQASKFFQLEDYLENSIRLAIQESIPFIDELDKTKVKDATQQ